MRELEFSDEVQADILKSAEEWGNECEKQSAFETLPKYAKKEFDFIITSFSEMMYGYHLQSPEDWTATALEEVLVDVFPRKMLVPETFFKAVEPALTFFVEYLRQNGVLGDKKALGLTNGLKKAAPVMRRRAKDSASFSPMKQLLLEGMEQGIDITDVDALNSVLKEMDMADRFPEDASQTPARSQKIGRNEPCPCGSGKKYKKCCGFGTSKEPSHMVAALAEPKEEDGKAPTLEQWEQLYEVVCMLI